MKLSDKDTSYLVVSQQPLLEEDLLKKQQSEISKRGRKEFGKTMMLSSLFPLAVGAIAGAFTYYEINQANDCKKVVENSAITDSKKYRNNLSDFKDHRRNAKIAKRTTYAGLAVGATLLSVGFILSF